LRNKRRKKKKSNMKKGAICQIAPFFMLLFFFFFFKVPFHPFITLDHIEKLRYSEWHYVQPFI